MAEYRHRVTGEIKTQGEWRRVHSNTSFPRVWTEATLDFLNVDPILSGTQPTPGAYQTVKRDGAIQDADGNWIENWVAVDMFATDDEGTKAEKEAAYQADLDATAARNVRNQRDLLLGETDWTALSDVTMSDEMATYRQALRDITSHANFPYLEEGDWPTKP